VGGLGLHTGDDGTQIYDGRPDDWTTGRLDDCTTARLAMEDSSGWTGSMAGRQRVQDRRPHTTTETSPTAGSPIDGLDDGRATTGLKTDAYDGRATTGLKTDDVLDDYDGQLYDLRRTGLARWPGDSTNRRLDGSMAGQR
jgi:hypothetical protein